MWNNNKYENREGNLKMNEKSGKEIKKYMRKNRKTIRKWKIFCYNKDTS